MLAFLEPGDEVVIIQPSYDVYINSTLAAGGVPVCVPLRPVRIFQTKRDSWLSSEPAFVAIKINVRLWWMFLNHIKQPVWLLKVKISRWQRETERRMEGDRETPRKEGEDGTRHTNMYMRGKCKESPSYLSMCKLFLISFAERKAFVERRFLLGLWRSWVKTFCEDEDFCFEHTEQPDGEGERLAILSVIFGRGSNITIFVIFRFIRAKNSRSSPHWQSNTTSWFWRTKYTNGSYIPVKSTSRSVRYFLFVRLSHEINFRQK